MRTRVPFVIVKRGVAGGAIGGGASAAVSVLADGAGGGAGAGAEAAAEAGASGAAATFAGAAAGPHETQASAASASSVGRKRVVTSIPRSNATLARPAS